MTVVLVVDEKTLGQAYYSIPTWFKNRRLMWSMPWVVVYDSRALSSSRVETLADNFMLPSPTFVPWHRDYDNQREKMLSAWVHAPPRAVETKWWMKVDTDVVARPCDQWIDDAWFLPDENGNYAEYIASSWNYTKAKGGGGAALEWCDSLEDWGDQFPWGPRLNLHEHINEAGDKIYYKRMCSYVSYYLAEASKDLADKCDWKLPVPSQDTVVWYYTERRGARCIRSKQKAKGWLSISNTKNMQKAALEIVSG